SLDALPVVPGLLPRHRTRQGLYPRRDRCAPCAGRPHPARATRVGPLTPGDRLSLEFGPAPMRTRLLGDPDPLLVEGCREAATRLTVVVTVKGTPEQIGQTVDGDPQRHGLGRH